jgi:hypothetical protein
MTCLMTLGLASRRHSLTALRSSPTDTDLSHCLSCSTGQFSSSSAPSQAPASLLFVIIPLFVSSFPLCVVDPIHHHVVCASYHFYGRARLRIGRRRIFSVNLSTIQSRSLTVDSPVYASTDNYNCKGRQRSSLLRLKVCFRAIQLVP